MQIATKNYTDQDFLKEFGLLGPHHRILNAGAGSQRYGSNCINVDIENRSDVDVVCDIRELPDSLGQFDAIICQAALQYCPDPHLAAKQFYKRLKPNGYLFVDAPWVQQYCPDGPPDLYRFSQDALRSIFSDFEVIKCGCSIRPGSAFALLGIQIAQTLTRNRYINYLLRQFAILLLFPLTKIRTAQENKTSGAFYFIGRRPPDRN